MKRIFSIDRYTFKYDSEEGRLRCDNGGFCDVPKGNVRDTFEFFLENPCNKVTRNQVYYRRKSVEDLKRNERVALSEEEKAKQNIIIHDIRKIVRQAAGFPTKEQAKESLPDALFLSRHGQPSKYTWIPVVRDEQEDASELLRLGGLEKEANPHIHAIMNALVSNFNDLDNFFYKTGHRGTRLQFHLLSQEICGTPSFPIPITGESPPAPDRGQKSLLRLRGLQNKPTYAGHIYRLHTVDKNEWTLGRTVYTELIDDCDFYNLHIKARWMQIGDSPELFKSDLVQSWYKRTQDIRSGKFSGYLAGLAFSIPLFQIDGQGNLKLLMAKGSAAKQAGGGLKHVVPAGMLEFSNVDKRNAELTLSAFQTYLAKELIEETLLFSQKLDKKCHRLFKQLESVPPLEAADHVWPLEDAGDVLPVETLRQLIETHLLDDWDSVWGEGKKPSQTVLREVLNRAPNDPGKPCFFIVDAFCLRPEIILPVYTTEDLEMAVNWENDAASVEKVSFASYSALEDWVAQNYHMWTAPGIAAAFLGAKHYFDKRDGWKPMPNF